MDETATVYIVNREDQLDLSYRGPYPLMTAESLVGEQEQIVTAEELAALHQERKPASDAWAVNNFLLREVRSWGFWSLGLGFLHLITAGLLNAPWGLLLIVVGLSSFYFRSPSMFVVYSTTLAWAGISNLTSGQGGWGIFALLQFYLSFRLFRQFLNFRRLQSTLAESSAADPFNSARAARIFPWAAVLLGIIALVGFVGLLVGAIGLAILAGESELPAFVTFAEGTFINLAILAFATGLASLLSRYRYKGLAIAGMISGLLVILLLVGLAFLPA